MERAEAEFATQAAFMADSCLETSWRHPAMAHSPVDGTEDSVSPTDLWFMKSAIRSDTTPSGSHCSSHCVFNSSFQADVMSVASPLRATRRLSFSTRCAKDPFVVDSPEKRKAQKPPLIPRSTPCSPEVDAANASSAVEVEMHAAAFPVEYDDEAKATEDDHRCSDNGFAISREPSRGASIGSIDESSAWLESCGPRDSTRDAFFIGSPPDGFADAQRTQRLTEMQKALNDGREHLAEFYRVLEEERTRHSAVEEFWRKTGEQVVADMHAADVELIKREARLGEREEQLQRLKKDVDDLQAKLADEREDFEEERRDQALRRSRIAERELQVQDTEAEMVQRGQDREDQLVRREQELESKAQSISFVDACIGTEAAPRQRRWRRHIYTTIGGCIVGMLIGLALLVVLGMPIESSLVSPRVHSVLNVTAFEHSPGYGALASTKSSDIELRTSRRTFDSFKTSRWMTADTLWFERSHPVLHALLNDVCPAELLKTPLESATCDELITICPNMVSSTAVANVTESRALLPYTPMPPKLRYTALTWRDLRIPASMLMGLFSYYQIY